LPVVGRVCCCEASVPASAYGLRGLAAAALAVLAISHWLRRE